MGLILFLQPLPLQAAVAAVDLLQHLLLETQVGLVVEAVEAQNPVVQEIRQQPPRHKETTAVRPLVETQVAAVAAQERLVRLLALPVLEVTGGTELLLL
jgi:hypothetical protein